MIFLALFEGGRALRQSDQNWAWRSQRVAVSWVRATFRRGKDTKRVSMSKACAFWTYRHPESCQNTPSHTESQAKSSSPAGPDHFSPALCLIQHNSFSPSGMVSSQMPVPGYQDGYGRLLDPPRAQVADSN